MNNKIDILISVLGFILLSYLFGVYSADKKLVTYPAFLENILAESDVAFSQKSGFWQLTENTQKGVVTNESEAFEGATMITSAAEQGAKLIDTEGNVLHQWQKPFRDIWSNPSHIETPASESQIQWRSTHLYPDGSLLAVYGAEESIPHGYGLAKLSADSEVMWRVPRRIHHQLEVTESGTIWALSQSLRDIDRNPVPGNPQITPKHSEQIIEDFVLKIDSEGKIIDKISILDALTDSSFGGILQNFPLEEHLKLYKARRWAPGHATDVEVINPALAKKVSALQKGDLLVSIRPLQTLVGLDPEKKRVVWASRGIWSNQHDPDPLGNGNLMVFDNLGHAGQGGRSRIIELNPASNAVPWKYTGTRQHPLFSFSEGAQQVLPNDNILITEARSGRVVEINQSGQILWEYYNPDKRQKKGDTFVAQLHHAKRYPFETLDFLEQIERKNPSSKTESKDVESQK